MQKLDATVKMGPHKNLMGIEADDAVELLQLVPSQVASRAPIERAPIDLLQLPVSESSAPPSSFELHAFLARSRLESTKSMREFSSMKKLTCRCCPG